MKRFFLILVLLFSLNVVLNAFESVAVCDNALSTIINPAGLGFKRTFEGYIISPFDTLGFIDETSIFLRAGRIGFNSHLYGGGNNFNSYTISYGTSLGENFYFGSGYRWFTKDKRSGQWDVGFLYRPFNLLSIGLTGMNINSPDELNPEYIIGLGVRPFGNRFTISLDGSLNKTETLDYGDELNLTAAAKFEPVKGIILKGHYSEDDFGVGVGINFRNFGIESYGNFNDDSKLSKGYVLTHLSVDRYRTVLKSKKKYWVVLKLKGPIIEERRKPGIFSKKYPSLKEILDIIGKIGDDPETHGIYLIMEEPECGFAKKQEIRKALSDFKSKDKKIYCYAQSLGNSSYCLATVADSLFMNPSGFLNLTGLYSEIPFLKGTLDKIGIEVEAERIGKYKSASEIFTEDSMSSGFREAHNAILDDLFHQFTSTIAKSRNMNITHLKDLIDKGPYTAKQAKDAALVDKLLYEDEVVERLKRGKTKLISLRRYTLLKDYVYDWQPEPRNKIAIIYATGNIVSGKSSTGGLFPGNIMGSETIVKAIRSARKDKNIKAIIFRIDSGGGSGLASDVIWREVKKTTDGKNRKPFIVSMSDVAGSGGYYIACAADVILADEGTITGSIGVIGGKFNFKSLYEKIGLRFETIEKGKHASMFSSTRPFTEEEREMLRKVIREFYEDFIKKVAEGRGLSTSKVDSIGRGRIWTGVQAKEIGLIDEIGGLAEAIKIAKRKAGLSEDTKVGIKIYPKYKGFRLFSSGFGGVSNLKTYIPEELFDIIGDLERYRIYENENILYIMPYTFRIE